MTDTREEIKGINRSIGKDDLKDKFTKEVVEAIAKLNETAKNWKKFVALLSVIIVSITASAFGFLVYQSDNLKKELKSDMKELKDDLKSDIKELKSHMKAANA